MDAWELDLESWVYPPADTIALILCILHWGAEKGDEI
jgi:hypothetical protein